jgi:hypothetical protein
MSINIKYKKFLLFLYQTMLNTPIQNTRRQYEISEVSYYKSTNGEKRVPKSFSVKRVVTRENAPVEDEDPNLTFGQLYVVIIREIEKVKTDYNRSLSDKPFYGGLNVQSYKKPAASNFVRYTKEKKFTIKSFVEQIESIIDSNETFGIEDFDFYISFFKDDMLVGSGNFKKPKWWGKMRHEITHKQYTDRLGPINCAAIAIVYNLEPDRYDVTKLSILKKNARKLQNDLQWGEYVSLNEITDLVKIYKDHKLLVFNIGTRPQVIAKGSEYVELENYSSNRKPKKVITLYFDMDCCHYVSIQSIVPMLHNQGRPRNLGYCFMCDRGYNTENAHECYKSFKEKKPIKCGICQGMHKSSKECKFYECRGCSTTMERSQKGQSFVFHRCPIIDLKDNKVMNETMNGDNNSITAFSWDIESRIETDYSIETPHEYETTEDFIFNDYAISRRNPCLDKQIANLICVKHVFSDFKIKFEGDNCLEEFVNWAMLRNGKSIFFAHNSARYDSRLLFDVLCRKFHDTSFVPRGASFLQIKVGKKLYFRDSMCHFPGSLKNIGKTLNLPNLQKGDFPHKFNRFENYDYEGPLPEKKYFDLPFSINTQKDYENFVKWYDERNSQGPWNFKDELLKYCEQDVLILAEFLKLAHIANVEKGRESPLFSVTGPSYVHKEQIKEITRNMELVDRKELPDVYESQISNFSKDSWCRLKDEEYWFAKKGLRGGRTDARCFYYKLTPEQISLGWKIVYQDVVSLYPSEQNRQEFPVGYPTIYWDGKEWPCRAHASKDVCTCLTRPYNSECLKVVKQDLSNIDEIILAQDFFGFIKIDATPPKNLYHPVLINYDEKREKCVASLEPIVAKHFTSIEVLEAYRVGYKITKIYTYHKYKRAPTLWGLGYVIEKLLASYDDMADETINKYERLWGIGDILRKAKSQGLFKYDATKRAIAKTNANCGWGKLCEKAIKSEMVLITDESELQLNEVLLEIGDKSRLLDRIENIDSNTQAVYSKQDAQVKRISFGSHYMPAGAFVPAYGRLTLWEQLNKLGERALYNDTDSIIYIYKPNEYNIPQGNILGEWEEEDISKIDEHGGIIEFVALGPKSYGIRCADGHNIIKCKGVRTNRATQKIFNFEKMVEIVKDSFEEYYEKSGEEPVKKKIKLLQKQFSYKLGQGIKVFEYLKEFGFDTDSLKGKIGPDYKLYPFGYQE